jgi:hypothetical protein
LQAKRSVTGETFNMSQVVGAVIVVEMADLRDLERIAVLFAEFCLSLKKGQRFKARI